MKRSPQKGFTLIEIVIVLAIAALIMVIVFLAVAGAQRSQRDTSTRNDAARVLAAAEQYASNNSGNYPPAITAPAGTFGTDGYLKGINSGSVTNGFAVNPSGTTGKVFYSGIIPLVRGFTCDPANPGLVSNGNLKQVAVVYWSEVANSQQCISN